MTIETDGFAKARRLFSIWHLPVSDDEMMAIDGDTRFDRGTSTAANPEWRRWIRVCSDTHSICKSLKENTDFFPKRLIELLYDGEWRLTEWDTTASIPGEYLTLSPLLEFRVDATSVSSCGDKSWFPHCEAGFNASRNPPGYN